MYGIGGECVRGRCRGEGFVHADSDGDGDGLRAVWSAPCVAGSLDGGLDVFHADDGGGVAGCEEERVRGFDGCWHDDDFGGE